MSVEHMAMVFAAEGLDGPEKLLLLAYTNYTDPHGYCWPGEDRLAEDTGTSSSTVRRTKKRLINKNLLRSIRRPETSNLARVNLPLLASMARERKAYDDNEMDRLSFDSPTPPTPETGPDLQTGQSDRYPRQASDLRTVQSDLDYRSDCSDGQVNLTCETGQSDLQSISDPPGETISRPSVPEASAEGRDGGTDGAHIPRQINRNPGVDLLLAIGAEKPEFLLTGKPLQDQGRVVAGMLLEGWTPEHLRQVVAGRPLPDQITTTVGAIVSGRLKQALAGPVPSSGQDPWEPFAKRDETPTPKAWTAGTVVPHKRVGECDAESGMCGRPTEPGEVYCRHHREDVMM
ncbi:helix-turn-helix domain-containing protein [Streptomyces longwoodensis]|uniref:helix-turn-helix domain-containing protein n=1 Tax=Streptomyces longwoodensis TaxID=68231 RepID=UPI002251099A|nr:helix-turn-helix domain-containing protein [Streptomyces longwoodensis]MCX5001019.1 helix-turn-helix domain-containing protein [Streptomyces longwoodensis]